MLSIFKKKVIKVSEIDFEDLTNRLLDKNTKLASQLKSSAK